MISIKKIKHPMIALGIVASAFNYSEAFSATNTVAVDAAAVRLQNYSGTKAVLWYTGAQCSSGQLVLDPTDTPDRNKQLWATVLAAKSYGGKLYFEYSMENGTCVIRSFAADTQ